MYNNNLSVFQPTEINIQDVIRDVCSQIDDKIILGLFLIFTFYVMSKLILPYARKGFEDSPFIDSLNLIFDGFESLSETLSLCSIFLIIIFKWIQGISTGFKVWAYVLLSLVIIVNIINVIEWRKRKNENR